MAVGAGASGAEGLEDLADVFVDAEEVFAVEPALDAAAPERACIALGDDVAGLDGGGEVAVAEAEGGGDDGLEGAGRRGVVAEEERAGDIVDGGDVAAGFAGVELEDEADFDEAADVEVEGIGGSAGVGGELGDGAGSGGDEGVDDFLAGG